MKKDEQGYLRDLLERIQRILNFTQPGKAAFFASQLTQDAVLRNFEVIGEIAKRLDKSFTDQHPEIAWRSMAAFRDVIIHDYEDLRLEIIWRTITDDLPTLYTAITTLLENLETDDENQT